MTDIITQIDLFEFINTFFTDKVKFAKITEHAKSGHSFMLNRFLSIYYPKEIQMINILHHPAIIDALQHGLCTGRVPRWIYTKSKKASQDPYSAIPVSVKQAFCKVNDAEWKSLDQMYVLWPEWVMTELNELQKTLDDVSDTKPKKLNRKRAKNKHKN